MKLHFSILLPILCFFLFFSSCAHPHPALIRAESLIENNPDSALCILRHIPASGYQSAENKALYGLLITEALDRKKLPLQPDSLLDFSLSYYEKHPDPIRLAKCYLYKGRIYKYKFKYDKAVSCLLNAEELARNSQEYLLIARIKFDLAGIYCYQKEVASARQKYWEAYRCYVNAKSPIFASTTLISIGITYSQEKKYNQAQRYFYKVYSNTSDSMVKGSALQNLGINYYYQKQLDSALYYLKKSIPYPYIQTNKAIRMLYLADLYFDLQAYDSACLYARQAFRYEPDIVTRREVYRILVNSYNATGDIQNIKPAMIGYQNCVDSLRKIDTQPKGVYLENLNSSTKLAGKSQRWIVHLCGAIFLIILLSVWLYRLLHKRKNREIKQVSQKHKEVMFRQRTALMHKIEQTKLKQTEKRKKLSFAEKEILDMKIYNDILHVQDTSYFFKLMDACLNHIPSKFKERYPEVSDREIQWCCLTLLEIPSTDIMTLLSYKYEALNKMKIRLAKKFQLQYASELMTFLKGRLSED